MDLVIRFEKNELCISHNDGLVSFTVCTLDNKQLDFQISLEDWEQLKTFVDDNIFEYKEKGCVIDPNNQ